MAEVTPEWLDRVEASLKPVQHQQLAQAKCSCGFDAYRISGIVVDYHEEILAHMRAARSGPTYRSLTRETAHTLLAAARESAAEVAAAKKRAWDEGYRHSETRDDGEVPVIFDNPYRADALAARQEPRA